MFCPNCGTKCDDGAVFCGNCGTALSNETETNAASVDTAAQSAAEITEEAAAPVEEKAEEKAAASVEEKVEEAAAHMEEEKTEETVASAEKKADDTASVVPPVTPITPVTPVTPVQPQFNNGQPAQPNNGAAMWSGQQPNQFNGQPVQPQPNQFNGQPLQQNAQKKAKKPFKIPVAAIVAVVAVVVIAIAAVVFTVIGKNSTDYKKTVKTYVEAVAKGDYEKAFNYVDLPESEFLTAEAFRMANGDAIVGDVTSLNVSDAYATVAAVDVKKVNVNYVLSIGKAENLTLDLKKSDEKFMLFFNKYEIMGDSLVKKDVVVIVPKGMSLKVNNIAVDSKYILSEDDAKEYYTSTKADVYKIPYIFIGIAKFTVCGDIIEEYEYEQEYEGDDYDVAKVNLLDKSYKYKESILSDLQKQAETDFNAMLKAALDNKEIGSTSVNIASANKSSVENAYESYFRGRLHRTSYYFDTMNVTNFKATTSGTSYSVVSTTGNPRVKVTLSFTSAGSYIYETTGNKYVQSERNSSSSYIYYVYEDGKWGISDMYVVLNTYSGTLQKNSDSTTEPSTEAN